MHPTDNDISVYIEWILDETTERPSDIVVEHIANCNDCGAVVFYVMESLHERE